MNALCFNEEFSLSQAIIQDLNKSFHFLNNYHASEITILICASRFHISPLQIQKMINIISEITKLINYRFKFSIGYHSSTFHSFLEHIKFLSYRIISNQCDYKNNDDTLKIFESKYAEAFESANDIEKFIYKKYNFCLSNTEKYFLTIHIQMMIYKTKT